MCCDLLGGERRGDLVLGLDPEQPDQRLGEALHQPDERAQRPGEPEQRRAPAPARRAPGRRARGSWGPSRRRRRAGRRRSAARAPRPIGSATPVGQADACRDTGSSSVVQGRPRRRRRGSTEQTVMPSWAQASSEPICSRASRQTWARRDPAAASGSSWQRRAAMTANSAPTKNALRSSSRAERDGSEAHERSGLVPSAAVAIASAPARGRGSGAAGTAAGRPGGRPSRATADRPAGGSHRVADDRDPAQLGHHEAADGLVGRPVRDRGAEPVAHLVGAPQPGHGPRPVGAAAGRWCATAVVLVGDLADDLLDDVLEGDDARRCRRTRRRRRRAAGRARAAQQQRVEPDRLGHRAASAPSAPRPARRRAGRAARRSPA